MNDRQLDPHRRPIAKRQIIDGDLSLADLLEGYLAMGAMRLGAPITTHRDLHSDLLDENLLHDTSGELEQGFEVEGLHTPNPRPFPDVSPLLHVSKSGGGPKKFGGGWSDEKLDALRSYLSAYTQALSKTSFERIYIDAFAGAGTREVKSDGEDQLFDEKLPDEDAGYRHGSPLIALGTEPPFHRFVFIERDAGSIAKLQAQVTQNFPAKIDAVSFRQGDANQLLQDLTRESWKTRRAVAFLDPFALHVKWDTIEMIASTQAIDMWLLFPAMAINRMLPRSGIVPPKWATKLTETFGSKEWESHFYEKQQADMFGEETISKQPKIFEKLSDFITMRLNTVFEGANKKPLILRNSSGAPLFLLCFASGNPKGAPIALRIANHIINKKSHGN